MNKHNNKPEKKKTMNTKVVSTSADSLLHFSTKPNPPSKNPVHGSMISFSPHTTNSRISIRNKTGPQRTRSTSHRIGASYAPAETKETLYELLGIGESGSTLSEIKKAYKQMARKYHPDVSPPDRVDEHTRRFILVHRAYETLSDPQSRASYDRDLAAGFGSFSSRRKTQHQKMEEREEWKTKWQSQLDELKRREVNNREYSGGGMSWGARMRNQI